MAAIQYTDRGAAVRLDPVGRVLTQSVLVALAAPSILNTQPWRWRIDHHTAELYAERDRQLATIDPEGRMLTLSCGAALHHARVALAADGVAVEVTRLPDSDSPDLLATLRYVGQTDRIAYLQRLRRAIGLRRTDRRPFAAQPVPIDALDRLREAAEAVGAHLHIVRPQDLVNVAVAAGHAANAESRDPAYREELAGWVHPRERGGDGVPPDTTPPSGARPVPIRDFTGAADPSIYNDIDVSDREARYAIIFTDGDAPQDWLIAGEALSAVLLTATMEGLATSPMSDAVEVPAARTILRQLLGNIGYPGIVVRVGVAGRSTDAPKSPRRPSADTVTVVGDLMGEESG
jgi:hypothetical protein